MLARLALYLWLAADSRGIVVVSGGGPDEGCPSARQVTDALGAKLPGVAAPPGTPASPGQVRLAVVTDSNGIRVDITDPAATGGTPMLRRQLPPPARARTSDCLVLAETVALIVERYWREVGYDVPASLPPAAAPPAPAPTAAAKAPPPAGPRPPPEAKPAPAIARRPAATTPSGPVPHAAFSLGAALAARTGGTGGFEPNFQLAVAGEREIGARGDRVLGLRLGAGMGTRATVMTPTGAAGVRRYPLRVGLYLPVNTPIGRLEPGIGAGVDLIAIDGPAEPPRTGSLCSPSLCASPGADLALGWSVLWDRHIYLRAFARGGVAAPFAFVTNERQAIWSTPRTYLEMALESGVWFP